MTMPLPDEPAEAHSSDDGVVSTAGKKGVPWSAAEHTAFLKGLQNLGKGNWRGISRMFVPSRSPTQVASHAQKYFLRLNGCTKRRSRFSGLEQGTHLRPPSPPAGKTASKAATPTSHASPTSSADGPPVLVQQQPAAPAPPAMMPMPFMFPPMMFTLPTGAPFVHPMFYQSLAAAGFPKGQGVMLPVMIPNAPMPETTSQAPVLPKIEGGDDSAVAAETATAMQLESAQTLPRPAARRSSTDQLKTSELFSQLQLRGPVTCHVALQASAQSAFRPAGRQLAV